MSSENSLIIAGPNEYKTKVKKNKNNKRKLGYKYEPKVVLGIQKYGGYRKQTKGLYSVNSFPSSLQPNLVKALIKAGNNSVTEGTWMQYKSARKHLEELQSTMGRRIKFPMSEEDVLGLVAHMFNKDLQGTTVSKTLSAIRKLHLVEGIPCPTLRTDLITDCIKGRENFDEERYRGKKERLPVTVTVMKLLKVLIILDKKMDKHHKALIWAVAAIAFGGCLRIGELLSKWAGKVDILNCLLMNDIWLTTARVKGERREILKIRLKSDKSSRAATRGCVLEVFDNKTELCPIEAFKKYLAVSPSTRTNKAAFRLKSGMNYRHQRFNDDLRKILSPTLPYHSYKGHSFRIGYARYTLKKY